MTPEFSIIELHPVDAAVEAYEACRAATGAASPRDYLPPRSSPHFGATLCELIRVDLELNWAAGDRPTIEDYLIQFPELHGSPEWLEQVAWEEDRVRRRHHILPRDVEDLARWTAGGHVASVAPSTLDREPLPTRRDGAEGDAAGAVPTVGEKFAGFQLVEELGRGSFGRVFLARQAALAGREVVVKLTPLSAAEPEALARLQHANIVPIHSVHCDRGRQAVCMPYLGRFTLAHALAAMPSAPRPRAPRDLFAPDAAAEPLQIALRSAGAAAASPAAYRAVALWLTAEISGGLAHAHARGLIHRDLKPANILLSDDARPMVLDFGLAQDVNFGGPEVELIGGTLPYMAPEHLAAVRDGHPVGPAADIYSLGVVLFELLTMRRPFADARRDSPLDWEAMIADRRRGAPSVRSIDRSLPRSVAAIVAKCLEFSPEDRYASAEELREDLLRELSHRPLRHAPDRSPVERVGKWLRRHPRATSSTTLAGAAVLVTALAIGGWLARGERIAHLEARQSWTSFQDALPELRLALSAPGLSRGEYDEAMSRVRRTLAEVEELTVENPTDGVAVRASLAERLSDEDRRSLRLEVGETWRFMALATSRRASRETDPQRRDELRRHAALQRAHADSAQELSAAVEPTSAVLDMLERGDYTAALPLLRKSCSAAPQDVSRWFLLGNCQVGAGQLAEAEATFSLAAALLPSSYSALFHRGLCRLEQHKSDEAYDDFSTVLELRPGLYGGLVNRALALIDLRRWREADRDLAAALSSPEAETRLHFLRSRVLMAIGDRAAAERELAAGMAREPEDEASWVARGMARLSTDARAALADFEAALRMNPDSLTALRNVAHVQAERLGETAAARRTLDRVLKLAPRDLASRASRGVLAARLDDRDAALADAEAVLAVPRDPRTTYKAACIFALLSRRHAADAARGRDLLAEALRRDATLSEPARTDADLESLRTDSACLRLIEAAAALCPTPRADTSAQTSP